MEHYTLDDAANLLKQPADYLRNKILFADKAHLILKPCVFLAELTSMRLAHRNANIYVKEQGIEHTMKSFNAPPDDPAEAARLKRVNRHWPEDALTPWEYPQVMRKGLFELTLYPEHMDMTEAKESGRIQLYREKAVRAPSTNVAVDRIMNNWYAMRQAEINVAKARTSQEVGDIVILTQGGLHYLVDVKVSIPLADIRITEKMLTEYAASEGITLPKNRTEMTLPTDQATSENAGEFSLQEVLPIRFIEFYTGGKLGPETTSLLFAHKQGIDWNRQMEAADKLTAYYWQHGKLTPLKRTEWESILHSIKSLSERFNKTEKHFDEWRIGGKNKCDQEQTSDVIDVLRYFATILEQPKQLQERLRTVLDTFVEGSDMLPLEVRNALTGQEPQQIALRILSDVFSWQAGDKPVYRLLKGASGEMGLGLVRGDEVHYFGVVNVGDVAGLKKALENAKLPVDEDALSGSLTPPWDSPGCGKVGSHRQKPCWRPFAS